MKATHKPRSHRNMTATLLYLFLIEEDQQSVCRVQGDFVTRANKVTGVVAAASQNPLTTNAPTVINPLSLTLFEDTTPSESGTVSRV